MNFTVALCLLCEGKVEERKWVETKICNPVMKEQG
jgi:hypothetical protein